MCKHLLSITFVWFMAMGLMAQQQFQNPGFEDWEEVGLGPNLMEPVNWSSIKTSDRPDLNDLAPVVWGKSEDAHSGNYSLYLHNFAVFGIVATGTITNGRVHASMTPDSGFVFTDLDDDQWNTPFTGRPDSVVGWYKANPMTDDHPAVRVVLHTGYQQLPGDESNIVAEAMLNLPGETVTEWTRFSVPFVYEKDVQPEYLLAILYSGNGTEAIGGSEAWFDDVEMIYPTGIDDFTADNFQVFYTYGALNVNLSGAHRQTAQLRLTDLVGRVVYEKQIETQVSNRFLINLPDGIYIASISAAGSTFAKKVLVQ
ncbi:MAG: T9SS type A sorting domain-containing protein [Bacteroidales bacterium]|nr:T9SS type A sorting domain-containing protein [Bacteroidales bacterium]